jgi:hypothetical protein
MTGPSAPLAKYLWSDGDFEVMGWHDAAVHALAVEPAAQYPGRLLVDLDYIVEWVAPAEPGGAFNFWLAPSTLVFDQAADLRGDLDLTGTAFELSLDGITRSEPDEYGQRTWSLSGFEFTLALRAPGFTQYIRSAPRLSNRQRLTTDERGGTSFAEVSHDDA